MAWDGFFEVGKTYKISVNATTIRGSIIILVEEITGDVMKATDVLALENKESLMQSFAAPGTVDDPNDYSRYYSLHHIAWAQKF